MGVFLCSCSSIIKPHEKPNILWICVDDMNDWMNPYGYDLVKTPHINSLAEEGVLFEKAYVPAPVCSAARSAIITGCMQTTFGTHNHRSGRGEYKILLPPQVKPIPQVFRENGFLTFNFTKDDYNFEYKREDLYDDAFNKLVRGNKKKKRDDSYDYDWFVHLKGKRFFGQLQLRGGKLGGEAGSKYPAESRVSEDAVTIPPFYPDNKIYRNATARHYEQVALLDEEIGHIVDSLKRNNLYENTAIIFYTDHGYQLPRAKQFCYEEGVKVPLIISWPRGKEYLELGGKRRADLVNCIDVAAVTLGLVDIPVPSYMEGKDLFHEEYEERPFVVSARDRCDYTVEQIRSIRSKKFRYIKNYKTDRPLLQPQYRDHYATMLNYKELYQQGKLNEVQSWGFAKRQAEELYDMEKDPFQINNLANDPKYYDVVKTHRDYLSKWISETGDMGQKSEPSKSLRDVYKRWKEKCVNPEFDKVKN